MTVTIDRHPFDPEDARPIPNTPDLDAPPPDDQHAPPPDTPPPPPTVARNGHQPGPRPIPHDLAAEAALLGAMLLNPDAVTTGLAIVEPGDYYNPAHAHIHTAIRHLHANGDPIDPATVADHLRTHHLLDTIGGPGLLANLITGTPSLRNADRYAGIVAAHAARRDLHRLFTDYADRAIRLDDPATLVDHALAQLEQAATPGIIRPLPWEDVAAVMRGDVDPIRPTILTRTDGQPLIYPGLTHWLMGEPGKGKAQPLDARVLTPTGWRAMGDLEVGDHVTGSDGHPTRVTGVYPQGTIDIYRITTSDGATTEACADHLWHTYSHNDRARGGTGTVRTTRSIAAILNERPGSRLLHLPVAAPVHYTPAGPLPLDPYLLGLLIGDGGLTKGVTFTSADPELHDTAATAAARHAATARPTSDPYTVAFTTPRGAPNPLLAAVQALGLYGHKSETKRIPPTYLTAPIADRVALLQGLMDTDGTHSNRATQFSTSSPGLAADFADLVRGLGGTATHRTKTPTYTHRGEHREGLTSHTLNIRLPAGTEPFRLGRKLEQWRHDRAAGNRVPDRSIVAVDHVGRKPAQCIAVAAPDRLYITDGHIVTHNTWVALAAAAEQIQAGRVVIYLDYEGSARIVGERLGALGLDPELVDAHLLYHRPGIVTRDVAARLTAAVEATNTALVIIDGVAKALAAAGLSEDKAPDVLQWLVTAVNPLAEAGAAVLMLDHVVKEKDGRGLWARGSGAKLGEVSGAAWVLRPDRPFSRTQAGRAHLVQAKDREGHVATDGATAAIITFTPSSGGQLTITLDPPTSAATDADEQFRPTGYMERLSKHVEQLNDAGIVPSVNESLAGVSGKRKHLVAALEALVTEGFVTVEQGPNRARLHRTTRPYRQADDPRSDRYDPPPSDTI